MATRPAAGGGIRVEVGPERFARWCVGFAERHGGLAGARLVVETAAGGQALQLTAADGSEATCAVPFPPLSAAHSSDARAAVPWRAAVPRAAVPPGAAPDEDDPDEAVGDGRQPGDLIARLVGHALAHRVVGVLLVRRGGYAAGVFEGARLAESKVGARHVQGRSKAGGWSQQRFARRREGQAREAYAAAANTAVRVLLPHSARLDALVVGGDAGAVAVLRADVRLEPLFAKEAAPFLNVGEPRMIDLRSAPEGFRAVRVRLVEPS
jgi:hypothetical protein